MDSPTPPTAPPAIRPPPVDQPQRTIGTILTQTSYGENEDIWDLFVRIGIIPAQPVCPECHRPLPFERQRSILQFSLQCSKCKVRVNLKDRTPLISVRNIRKFFSSLEGWCNGDKVCSIRAKSRIAKDTWRTHKTAIQSVVDRSVIMLEEAPDGKLGGPGVVVEVDECHLHSRKYQRGAHLATEKIWAVGVIERARNDEGGRKAAFFITEKRGAGQLVPFIKKWVARDSILISDEWRGYSSELEPLYYRATVNHSVQCGYTAIVNGQEISINTNHIEREWREVRKVLEFLPPKEYQSKLNQEVFRLLYFRGRPKTELPYIFLEKMAELMGN